MPVALYSSASVDSLLSAKLSDAPIDGSTYGRQDGAWVVAGGGGLTISDLSNAATATLNAGVPTAGQALTYDGTDLIWATVSGVTSDKVIANAFASSMWYAWDGYDYARNGVVNTLYISGSYLSAGISDGTTFAAGFPATNATLNTGSYWYVSINGTLSDLYIFSP